MGTCKYCSAELNKKYALFCNSSCAAKFNNAKRKKSGYTTKGKTKNVECIKCGKIIEVSLHSGKNAYVCENCGDFKLEKSKKYKCICCICGNEFYSYHKKSKHCSNKCSQNDPATKNKLREKQLDLIKEGKHQGWQTRNIRSYPEEFWKSVLDNNLIQYKQEVYIKDYGYFLDFVIETNKGIIDLEIDGSQH